MPEAFRAEFTGERVIPGRVEDNLFNEHLARYRFTARLWEQADRGGRVLDAGCGAGYGTVELARSAADVLGIDVSEDAIAHARSNYAGAPNVRFEQASCVAIPAQDGAFHLITAFEVIEHLDDWRGFLREAARVLDDSGVLLVSTPNKLYYAESRQKAGPNPFHVHEFTEDEFRSELSRVFPHVKILLQNHVEGIAFSGTGAEGAALEISERNADPDSAHFFLAVCGKQPLPRISSFVFIPESGNVLQTRERHIALLDEWIAREQVERRRMLDKVRDIEGELEQHNQWARQANAEAERRARLVAALQAELQRSNAWAQSRDKEALERGRRVDQLQDELAEAVAWAGKIQDGAAKEIAGLQDQLRQSNECAEERGRRVVQLQEEIAAATSGYEAAIEQWRQDKAASDRWAMGLDEELHNSQEQLAALHAEMEQLRVQLDDARARMDMIAQSRWVRLGRVMRIGPEIHRN